MKKVFFLFVLSCCLDAEPVLAQDQPIRLIVRGDDMGFSHSGNQALIRAYQEGIETSIEVMVPTPWFPEAVQLLRENPGVDVGIHLVLTSEWDNVKWRPVAHVPSLTDDNGYFFPMLWPNKNYPGNALLQHPWKLEDIEKEWRAQIELAKKHIPRLSHISGHMGCTQINDTVNQMARSLAREYGLDIDLDELGVKTVGYEGASRTAAEKRAGFIGMLEKLEPGNTYMFLDHPGLDGPELQAIHHIGYEFVAADRQGVTDIWTDRRIKKAIRKKGIQLISYRDLKKDVP